jgi:hypothetical protein
MASTLDIVTNVVGDHYLITGSLRVGGSLPREIFIYENTGGITLGDFYGTCNVQELGRLQIFTPGTAIPLFGNRYVRNAEVKIKVALTDDPVAVVSALVNNVKSLSTAYSQQVTTTSSFNIP